MLAPTNYDDCLCSISVCAQIKGSARANAMHIQIFRDGYFEFGNFHRDHKAQIELNIGIITRMERKSQNLFVFNSENEYLNKIIY